MSYSGNPDQPYAPEVPEAPLVPEFPHLPAWAAGPIADWVRKCNDGTFTFTPQGHVEIPPEDETWIEDNVTSHVPTWE